VSKPKVRPETVEAAKAFLGSLKVDFESKNFDSPIVAGWTKSGFLLVACRGHKANTLDALLRDNHLAIPDGRERDPEQQA
jgi:hypothetical protein